MLHIQLGSLADLITSTSEGIDSRLTKFTLAKKKEIAMAGIVVKSPIRSHTAPEEFSMIASADAAAVENSREPEIESRLAISLKKGSLSETDQQILALLQQVPKKRPNTCMVNFRLYQSALKIYQAVTTPSECDECTLDKAVKRKVYQLVFDALYRKLKFNAKMHNNYYSYN